MSPTMPFSLIALIIDSSPMRTTDAFLLLRLSSLVFSGAWVANVEQSEEARDVAIWVLPSTANLKYPTQTFKKEEPEVMAKNLNVLPLKLNS
jgi:hypothetical protein